MSSIAVKITKYSRLEVTLTLKRRLGTQPGDTKSWSGPKRVLNMSEDDEEAIFLSQMCLYVYELDNSRLICSGAAVSIWTRSVPAAYSQG